MPIASSVVIALTTFPVESDVMALARMLVDERVAACVNVLPAMQSIYRWQGRVEQAAEHQLIIKTTAGQVETLKARLAALHPYDVPELLVLRIEDGAGSYLKWVSDSVGKGAGPFS